MCFLLVSSEATTKKETVQKNRYRSALQNTFVARVHSVLDAVPCFWDACRGHVCDLMPLAGSRGYSRHIVSLWHAFLTGHTFSSHKAALFRAETEILARPPLKVCGFGSSAASNAPNWFLASRRAFVFQLTLVASVSRTDGLMEISGTITHFMRGTPPQNPPNKFPSHLRARLGPK